MAEKLTKNEKRELAREQARERREQELKAKKRRGWYIKIGIIVAILAVAGIVLLTISAANKPAVAQANPKNMISNGVLFNGSTTPVETPAIPEGGKATPTTPSTDKVNVSVYLDYACPYCKKFEEAQTATLKQYVERGQIALEYFPIGFLSTYSGIAVNATACVAANEPNKWWDANNALYVAQPEEVVAKGFSKTSSVKFIKDAWKDLSLSGETKSCISDLPYINWAADVTSNALSGPLPNTDNLKVEGTPYVLVDGKFYQVDYINDPKALSMVIDAAITAKNK